MAGAKSSPYTYSGVLMLHRKMSYSVLGTLCFKVKEKRVNVNASLIFQGFFVCKMVFNNLWDKSSRALFLFASHLCLPRKAEYTNIVFLIHNTSCLQLHVCNICYCWIYVYITQYVSMGNAWGSRSDWAGSREVHSVFLLKTELRSTSVSRMTVKGQEVWKKESGMYGMYDSTARSSRLLVVYERASCTKSRYIHDHVLRTRCFYPIVTCNTPIITSFNNMAHFNRKLLLRNTIVLCITQNIISKSTVPAWFICTTWLVFKVINNVCFVFQRNGECE